MDALLDVVAADLVALAGESALIAHQVGGVLAIDRAVLDRAHRFGHRLFGFGAFLRELGGVAYQRGAVGAPEAAGTGLAIGGLEYAGGNLGWRQHRAVEDVEGKRARRHVRLESHEAVGTSDTGRVNGILADDIDDAALR